MPKFEVTHIRRVRETEHFVVEADSESAVRQMMVGGEYSGEIGVDEIEEISLVIDKVSDDTVTTEEEWDRLSQPLVVWFGIVDHRHGTDHYAGASQEEVKQQIAAFCREWADYEGIILPDATADGEEVTNRDVIGIYFDNVADEHHEIIHLDVAFP